jgi:hypothetical protein
MLEICDESVGTRLRGRISGGVLAPFPREVGPSKPDCVRLGMGLPENSKPGSSRRGEFWPDGMRELILAGGSSGGSSMMRLKRSVREPAVLERERVPRRARGFMLLGDPAPEREGCDGCDTLGEVSGSFGKCF